METRCDMGELCLVMIVGGECSAARTRAEQDGWYVHRPAQRTVIWSCLAARCQDCGNLWRIGIPHRRTHS